MVKKIKELTKEEIKRICREYEDNLHCEGCPFEFMICFKENFHKNCNKEIKIN